MSVQKIKFLKLFIIDAITSFLFNIKLSGINDLLKDLHKFMACL